MKMLGLRQSDLATKLNISRQYVNNIYHGRENLSEEKLLDFAKMFDINLHYYFTGNGEIFINECEDTHVIMDNTKSIEGFKFFGKRLGQILSDNQETPYSFSKRTGIKESRIEKFILDLVEPSVSELNTIKSHVDVSIDWLLYGEIVKKCTHNHNNSLNADEILILKKLAQKTVF